MNGFSDARSSSLIGPIPTSGLDGAQLDLVKELETLKQQMTKQTDDYKVNQEFYEDQILRSEQEKEELRKELPTPPVPGQELDPDDPANWTKDQFVKHEREVQKKLLKIDEIEASLGKMNTNADIDQRTAAYNRDLAEITTDFSPLKKEYVESGLERAIFSGKLTIRTKQDLKQCAEIFGKKFDEGIKSHHNPAQNPNPPRVHTTGSGSGIPQPAPFRIDLDAAKKAASERGISVSKVIQEIENKALEQRLNKGE